MNALSLLKVEELLSKKDMKQLIKICIYLSKMTMYDYEVIKETSSLYLGAAVLHLSLKIMQKTYISFPVLKLVFILFDFLFKLFLD
jgi:hypothetical protein